MSEFTVTENNNTINISEQESGFLINSMDIPFSVIKDIVAIYSRKTFKEEIAKTNMTA